MNGLQHTHPLGELFQTPLTLRQALIVIHKCHEARHSGRLQAVCLAPSGNANLFQKIAGIQDTWTYLNSPFMALDTRFPAGMTTPALFVYNDERQAQGELRGAGYSTRPGRLNFDAMPGMSATPETLRRGEYPVALRQWKCWREQKHYGRVCKTRPAEFSFLACNCGCTRNSHWLIVHSTRVATESRGS